MKNEIKDNLRDGAQFKHTKQKGGAIYTLAFTPAVKGWGLYHQQDNELRAWSLTDKPADAFGDDHEDFEYYDPKKA